MAKIKFYTTLNRPPRRQSNIGCSVRYEYVEKFDRSGKPFLEISKEIDLDELIQADAESCRISNIVNRYLMGDCSAFEHRPVVYADTTNMPTSLIDAYNIVQETKSKFDSFEKELKAKYNNSFGEFLASLDKSDVSSDNKEVSE